MTMKSARIALGVAAAVTAAQPAFADSDGYFCAAPGMLAYEISMSDHPDGVPAPSKGGLAGHRLYLVFYGDAGIEELVWVDLPEFQTHGMQCRSDAVVLLGWDKVHIVALDRPRHPRLMPPLDLLTRERLPGFASGDNLGAYYKGFGNGSTGPQPVELPAPAGSSSAFRLVLNVQRMDQCEATFETFIEQVGTEGATSSRRKLTSGHMALECGH